MRESTAFLVALQSAYNSNDVLDTIHHANMVETLYSVHNDSWPDATVALVVYHEVTKDYDVMVLSDMQGGFPTSISEVKDYDWTRFEDFPWLSNFESPFVYFADTAHAIWRVVETDEDLQKCQELEKEPGKSWTNHARILPNGDLEDVDHAGNIIGDIQAFGKYFQKER